MIPSFQAIIIMLQKSRSVSQDKDVTNGMWKCNVKNELPFVNLIYPPSLKVHNLIYKSATYLGSMILLS